MVVPSYLALSLSSFFSRCSYLALSLSSFFSQCSYLALSLVLSFFGAVTLIFFLWRGHLALFTSCFFCCYLALSVCAVPCSFQTLHSSIPTQMGLKTVENQEVKNQNKKGNKKNRRVSSDKDKRREDFFTSGSWQK